GGLRDALQGVLDRAYDNMEDAFQGTRDVLEEVSGQLFGRDAARDKLNRFLLDHDRGVLLITAPAGLGKSALLGDWSSFIAGPDTVVARHFFTTRQPGTSTPASMVSSLAGQIARALGPGALGGGVPGG